VRIAQKTFVPVMEAMASIGLFASESLLSTLASSPEASA